MDDETIRTAIKAWNDDPTAAEAEYGHISTWDTGRVTDMSNLITVTTMGTSANSFNEDISAWDTSSVTDMNWMFFASDAFNAPIGGWDVSKVTDMSNMFAYATIFNQPIGGWCVHNVENMNSMFNVASAFNQDLSNWQVAQVTDMKWMFDRAEAFDQDLGWCVDDDVDIRTGQSKCDATSCGVEQKEDASECPASLATCAALGSDDAKARSVAFGLLVTVALFGAAF